MSKDNRVAPRVTILPLHRITFTPAKIGAWSPLHVRNISSTGVGLIPPKTPEWEGQPETLEGRLAIGDNRVSVIARVMHTTPAIIGCRFEGDLTNLNRAVENYFKVELNALKARRISPDVLKKDPRGTPHWFVADNNSELYYVENAGNLVHFRLSVFGNSLDGGEGKPITYGIEGSERTTHGKGSVLIQTTEDLPPEVIESAIRFVEGVEQAPREIKDLLTRWIASSSKR